jgi:hypothetical protein
LDGGVLVFTIIGIRKRKGKRNIPGIFQNLNIWGYLECIFEQSARIYFWAIHEQRFMLVVTVPTYCVTWDHSQAGPR